MNWVLMAIGYLFVDVSAWSLEPLQYLGVQIGCVFLYVGGAWHD